MDVRDALREALAGDFTGRDWTYLREVEALARKVADIAEAAACEAAEREVAAEEANAR